MKKIIASAIILQCLFFSAPLSFAQERQPSSIYLIPIKGDIDLGLSGFVKRVLAQAKTAEAKAIILEVNTFGGRVDAATEIRDEIFNAGITVIAFINKRAISAGALISLSADTIVMAPGSTIGAATPVRLSEKGSEPTGEKEISYVRKEFKATAERAGHPHELAEAMVDPDVEIKGVVEKGKLLTLTTQEAVHFKLARFQAEDLNEVLRLLNLQDFSLERIKISWSENFVRFITNPILSSFLLSLGFLGIFFELRIPGWGVSGSLGVLCLVLFFGGHYLVGMAQWIEIVLFVLGVVLLLMEIFVIPGFGVCGVAGIILIFSSIFLALIKSPLPHIPVLRADYLRALYIMTFSLLTATGIAILGYKYIGATRAWKKFAPYIVLGQREEAKRGFQIQSVPGKTYTGKTGKSLTILHPSGKALFGEEMLDVVSGGEYIAGGEKIRIIKVQGNRIIVEKVEEEK